MANILGLVQLLCHKFSFYELCYELSFALLLEFKMTSDNAWLHRYQFSNPNLQQLLHVFIFHAAEINSWPSELPPALIPDTYSHVSAATKRIKIEVINEGHTTLIPLLFCSNNSTANYIATVIRLDTSGK